MGLLLVNLKHVEMTRYNIKYMTYFFCKIDGWHRYYKIYFGRKINKVQIYDNVVLNTTFPAHMCNAMHGSLD